MMTEDNKKFFEEISEILLEKLNECKKIPCFTNVKVTDVFSITCGDRYNKSGIQFKLSNNPWIDLEVYDDGSWELFNHTEIDNLYYDEKTDCIRHVGTDEIEGQKGIDTMTNKELFKLWEEFRAEQYHCYPDENGNYPCDNGELCDQCCTSEAIRRFSNWKRHKENQPIGYRIHVKDIVTYEFGINYTREKAVEQALEWFADREPCVEVEELR